MSDAVIPSEVHQAAAVATPMEMLSRAIDRGIDADQLDKLLALNERWEAEQARKAYVVAMAALKSEPLVVKKTQHVGYTSKRTNEKTGYDHATLADVVDVVVPAMSRYGLSHHWETTQADGMIKVQCVITHSQGHSTRVELKAGADDSGNKNRIQAIGSTVTYLQRYTLMSALGLAAADIDDDGRGASEPVECITPSQVADLEALLTETGGDIKRFARHLKVDSLDQIPSLNYAAVCDEVRSAAIARAKRAG